MDIKFEILIILLLIVTNGVLAMAEVAMIYARKVRLKQRALQGDSAAKVALALASEPARFLSTVQIGITLVGILTGVFGGATVSEVLAEQFRRVPPLANYAEPLAFGCVVIALTYLSLIFGELVPKNLALRNAEGLAIAVARPMLWLSRLTSPAVTFLTFSTHLVLRLLRIKPLSDPGITEEELLHTIHKATQSGVLLKTEQELVKRILLLGDRQITSFMTPRTEITWLDLEDGPEENWRKITQSKVFTFPICRNSLDEVVGIAAKDTLWEQYGRDRVCKPEKVMEPPLLVPDSVPALRALDLMKNTHQRLAIVMDEYGGVSGLVSLTDFVSVVFLGLRSHAEEEEPMAVRREDGSWLISGMMPIEEFSMLFRLQDKSALEEIDVDTVGGLVMNDLGRIPCAADSFERYGLRFEVMDMDGRRVDKVLVSRIVQPDSEAQVQEDKQGEEDKADEWEDES